MKKLFILLTLIGGTGASAFAMGNDAVRDFDRTLSQPTKEVPMNVLAMGSDSVRDHDRIIAQANTIA